VEGKWTRVRAASLELNSMISAQRFEGSIDTEVALVLFWLAESSLAAGQGTGLDVHDTVISTCGIFSR
jgi:hypothetical protein